MLCKWLLYITCFCQPMFKKILLCKTFFFWKGEMWRQCNFSLLYERNFWSLKLPLSLFVNMLLHKRLFLAVRMFQQTVVYMHLWFVYIMCRVREFRKILVMNQSYKYFPRGEIVSSVCSLVFSSVLSSEFGDIRSWSCVWSSICTGSKSFSWQLMSKLNTCTF